MTDYPPSNPQISVLVAGITAAFGIAVISSGLYRYFMEPGGDNGLWFGLITGAAALLAAWLQTKSRWRAPGLWLALIAGLLVGGWFSYENFVKQKFELRMYLMIGVATLLLAALAASAISQQRRKSGNQ